MYEITINIPNKKRPLKNFLGSLFFADGTKKGRTKERGIENFYTFAE